MFQSNVINIYGEKGKVWLDELPQLVTAISSKLDLRDLKEVTNLSYNYVLSGFQGDNPIILKLGLDSEGLAREAFALKCFAGYGAVKVLAEDDLPDEALAKAGGMLLLERAVPGMSLKSYFLKCYSCNPFCHSCACGNLVLDPLFQGDDNESIEIACGVIKKLHQASIPAANNFPHIKDWLAALDKDWNIPNHYLQKARMLRDQLLQTSKPDVLLHGDLHHDNFLQNGDEWLVIDPKGVIGESAYEVAAFIRNPPTLLAELRRTSPNSPLSTIALAKVENIIHNRITRFATILELPSQRILDWCFVQSVLCWAWELEDGSDASYFQQLTKIFDKRG